MYWNCINYRKVHKVAIQIAVLFILFVIYFKSYHLRRKWQINLIILKILDDTWNNKNYADIYSVLVKTKDAKRNLEVEQVGGGLEGKDVIS